MFKMELLECQRENIDCKGINFMDNQDSVDLIGIHIFQILDDQCRLPNASDQKFAAQVINTYYYILRSTSVHTYIHTYINAKK